MRRFKLLLEFDGTPFHGLQKQDGLPTVQGEIERALKTLANEEITSFEMAGRTDAGVHARGMVCHVDLHNDRLQLINIKDGLNCLLRPHIAVREVAHVDEKFQARFAATARRYNYKILNRRAHAALEDNRAAHIKYPLDIDLMRKEAAVLVGRHDFSAFRSNECQAKSPVTEILHLNIVQEGELITIDIKGVAFLHNMVRIIVGTLVDIGRGAMPAGTMKALLASKQRTDGGRTMPPCGLYFMDVDYPENLFTVFETC
ncbi:MAG: tRNA pseudouridine(38-40) synthase TruA [Proteobacteria bacterium]|nr:tRNA pseudouridine(38-40) synthase TruA [Pseudomonadota bacterium]